jgi:GNAT superfamily N-acetyltransferase
MLTLKLVGSAAEKRLFAACARTIYSSDMPWVRPLDRIVLDYLDAKRNPFYRDGRGRAFLALRDGRPIGRILAHVWGRRHPLHCGSVGYFGFYECAKDPEASAALFNAAVSFARESRCEILRGPFNMTAAQEIGIVVGGFDQAPAVDMVFTPSWYPQMLEASGFRQCLSMQTWRNDDISSLEPETMLSSDHREIHSQIGMTIRPIRSRHRDQDLELVRELVSSAFLGNWEFVPITREEWRFQIGPLVPFLDPTLVLLAEVQGVPVGVTFTVPDFNHFLRRMNGRLVHPAAFGLFRRPPTDAAVVILFAVRKQYRGIGVSRALNRELVRALRRGGYRSLAITWIAVENQASRAQARSLGMHQLHSLSMYERPT